MFFRLFSGIVMSTRRKREAPKPPRPLSKPPPPPKPEHLSMGDPPVPVQVSAMVHTPPPSSPPPPPTATLPPYTTHPLYPTRPAPVPPSAPGVDTLQRPPPGGDTAAQIPVKRTPDDETITAISAPEVNARVSRPPSYSTGRRRGNDIEMEVIGGRHDPDVTQRAELLNPRKVKDEYNPMELPPPDYFILSLITCLCCCLPIGCLALIFSSTYIFMYPFLSC